MRLWLPQRKQAVLLVPLVSWIAPANHYDGLFLEPSLRHVSRYLDFTPSLVIGDMAYIDLKKRTQIRDQMGTGILTPLPANYELPEVVRPALLMRCRQGQRLQWLGFRADEQLHWFGVPDERNALCQWCWERSHCPREFSFAPTDHEIALGTIPVNTRLARKLLRQSRGWIEAAQSYEKNQLGLSSMFFNSLRLTAVICLLADTVSLLRAHALLGQEFKANPLEELLPNQLNLDLQ